MSLNRISDAEQHDHLHTPNRFAVIPVCERLKAGGNLTGHGVTIAFLDSGFFPHPDLTRPVNRILAFYDVTGAVPSLREDRIPEGYDWHGTQTSVVAAGNGYLSGGVYRALASGSEVVLVKVSSEGKISEENILRGLEWAIQNKDRYNIRVLSISLGGDRDEPHRLNAVDRAAEAAVQAGLTLVVAAGNAGCSENHQPVPPANAPSVITVGGFDDLNQPMMSDPHLYCSSFGPTADGILKPEILAPAIWVAAPILPLTSQYRKAEALSLLQSAPDYKLPGLVEELWRTAGLPGSLWFQKPAVIRSTVETILSQEKFVAAHYQHVDGTSFAAPIVASLVALMLEVNPDLQPATIKNILISTADRIADAPSFRQGYGMLNASRAIEFAMRENHHQGANYFNAPRIIENQVCFYYHHDSARHVALAGEFNSWNAQQNILTKQEDGIWTTRIPCPGPGRYPYKFVVDDRWTDDPSNAMKEPDPYGGLNSILNIVQEKF